MKESIEDIFPALIGKSEEERIKLLNKLLDRAWHIRNFEINLYWKRATYFWVFIGASFTGYFLISDFKNPQQHPHLPILVGCTGFIFSISWYCVNRGSKYWQENWEAKITLIEDELQIILNNLQFTKEQNEKDKEDILGRRQFSVTKINSLVSLFISVIWIAIIFHHVPQPTCGSCLLDDWKTLSLLLLTLFTTILIFNQVDSIQKDNNHRFLLYR